MAKTSTTDIKTEIVNFIRNSDIISVSDRKVTTSSDSGTFAAAATHTLATNPTLMKNIRSIIVGGTTLSYGKDYTFVYATGVITFTVAQTGVYTISYDQGSSDRIFPDFPQDQLKIKDFPRISVDILSGTTSETELGAGSTDTEYLLTMVCYNASTSGTETMISELRSTMLDNKKTFYYLPFITPTSMGPIIVNPIGQNKIFQKNQDFIIKFIFEN